MTEVSPYRPGRVRGPGLIDLAREYRIVVGGAAANRADFGEDILTLTGSLSTEPRG